MCCYWCWWNVFKTTIFRPLALTAAADSQIIDELWTASIRAFVAIYLLDWYQPPVKIKPRIINEPTFRNNTAADSQIIDELRTASIRAFVAIYLLDWYQPHSEAAWPQIRRLLTATGRINSCISYLRCTGSQLKQQHEKLSNNRSVFSPPGIFYSCAGPK